MCAFRNQRTNGPVNAHLIWTILLVGEQITPALGIGLYGAQEHGWQDLYRGLLNIATHKDYLILLNTNMAVCEIPAPFVVF